MPKPTRQLPVPTKVCAGQGQSTNPKVTQGQIDNTPARSEIVTRSGRVVKPSVKFKDFVK